MNSAARSIGQSYVASLLERIGGTVPAGRVLEVGCGGGAGVKIILLRFEAAEGHAIDIDPKMIERARRRLTKYAAPRVRLGLGDITSLKAEDASFDAVFDFGAIHIEQNWEKALAQISRVLKPGGRYFFELVTSRALRLAYPFLSEGFATMQPPTARLFFEELERDGIVVGRHFVRPRFASLTGYVGDLVGVGWRAGPTAV